MEDEELENLRNETENLQTVSFPLTSSSHLTACAQHWLPPRGTGLLLLTVTPSDFFLSQGVKPSVVKASQENLLLFLAVTEFCGPVALLFSSSKTKINTELKM